MQKHAERVAMLLADALPALLHPPTIIPPAPMLLLQPPTPAPVLLPEPPTIIPSLWMPGTSVLGNAAQGGVDTSLPASSPGGNSSMQRNAPQHSVMTCITPPSPPKTTSSNPPGSYTSAAMLTTSGFNSLRLLADYLLALETPHYDHTSPPDRATCLGKIKHAAENVSPLSDSH